MSEKKQLLIDWKKYTLSKLNHLMEFSIFKKKESK